MLEKIALHNFNLENGKQVEYMPLFYQTFGQPIGSAPIVVVNHALTGNSNVTGENGWWNDLIGENNTIDTNHFTVIAFNIPGNGFDKNAENLISNYQNFTIRDIASIFWKGLFFLNVHQVFATIGGSLGGAIAWEMALLQPNKIQNLIPIATDWKATDWVIANVLIQDQILNNSENPIADARLHAMLLYRTPQSINERFKREHSNQVFHIENWLTNHGEKLKNRFQLQSYKLMNHLLKTNDITRDRKDFLSVANEIKSAIHIISVDSDYFFIANENQETYHQLKTVKQNVFYNEIKSIHGHDAFLIEFNQLNEILEPIFNKKNNKIMSTLRINVVLFGIGNVGSTLINQVIESQKFFLEKRNIDLRFPIITNSTLAFFEKEGLKNQWEANFAQSAIPFRVEDIIEYVQEQQLENLITVDATASPEIVKNYISLMQNGFNIVAANKKANTLYQDFYKEIRRNLKKFDKTFLYETNVGAGLPVVQTINDLHFSGSLSYIFNRFSNEETSFSNILIDAEKIGLTEPDSREDLSGNDLARKLLILAREIGLDFEFDDIKIESLLLPELNEKHTKAQYAINKSFFDKPFQIAKITQAENHALRYIGELDVEKKLLEVKLVSEPKNSALGKLKGADNLIEIYTKSYGEIPIVIQGAGAGRQVTARGVLTDILKLAEKIKIQEAVFQ